MARREAEGQRIVSMDGGCGGWAIEDYRTGQILASGDDGGYEALDAAAEALSAVQPICDAEYISRLSYEQFSDPETPEGIPESLAESLRVWVEDDREAVRALVEAAS